jgi:hypothetical protein
MTVKETRKKQTHGNQGDSSYIYEYQGQNVLQSMNYSDPWVRCLHDFSCKLKVGTPIKEDNASFVLEVITGL